MINTKLIDGSMQEKRYSIANALGLRLSCTSPYIWGSIQNTWGSGILRDYNNNYDVASIGNQYIVVQIDNNVQIPWPRFIFHINEQFQTV